MMLLEDRRQSKLVAARRRYEHVMQQHPQLAALEEQLIALYSSRVRAESQLTPSEWNKEVKKLEQLRQKYMQEHNIAPDFAEPDWDCPLCQDTGIVQGQICACERQRALEQRFRGARLPARLREQTFSSFSLEWYSPSKRTPLGNTEREHAADVLHTCQAFVASAMEDLHGATGIFLTGESGLGKTFLCSAICHALAENGIVPLYIVFSDLLSSMRDSFGGGTDYSANELLETARQVPVLILDDLGAEYITDFAVSRLFDIVNYRRNEQLPMVISSNLTLLEVAQVYSQRVASRIAEACQPVMLFGTDRRAPHRKLGLDS